MGVEYDRKQLALKQKQHEEAKRKAADLRSTEAGKLAEANKSRDEAAKFAKDAQVWEKKAAGLEKDIQKLDAKVAKANA